MTVKELIDKLGQYDPDKDVVISTYAYPGNNVKDVNDGGDIIEIM